MHPHIPALVDPMFDAPAPVLFNAYKHHASALRRRVAAAAAGGNPALDDLADELVVIGTELMDLYVGTLTPAAVAGEVLADLDANGRLALPDFRRWVDAAGGFSVLDASDGSRWVLRAGDEGGRYVHLHPGRWSPHTLRVRANVLKTAVLALAYAAVHGGDALDRPLLNAVRADFLGLAPLGRDPNTAEGLGEVIAALRG
jgi:hypothetical protein